MYFMEYEVTEAEALDYIQEVASDERSKSLREEIINPIINVLEQPKERKQYIDYGSTFLGANADMLAKEYPTKPVAFPRKYVDDVLGMFGFTVDGLKKTVKEILKVVNDKASFATIMANPTNIIHSIVLSYSDMIGNRELRDSARQQLGLCVYSNTFNKYFPSILNEGVMAYTYMSLDGSWGIVKSENMINWICDTTETAFGFWRSKLSLDMSPKILVDFLNRVRNSFNQNMHGLANKYYDNKDKGNLIGDDLKGDEDFVMTNNTTNIRNNLMRLIKDNDYYYYDKNKLYPSIARMKNVKTDTLYEYSTNKISYDDISLIMDVIFYVFIVKEGNTIEDINSTKFIGRITNLPTAVDRAISGKPIISPLAKKYEVDDNIVKAHICLVATYMLGRINDVNKK